MSKVTEVGIDVSLGGTVQIIKFEYTETFRVSKSFTYSGDWTEEEANAFYDERYEEIYADVEAKAQAEVDRLEAMRDEINGVSEDDE